MTSQRHGFFLVLVLIVIVVATLACYSFTELMVAYDDSAYLSGDIVQARMNVESGIETTRLILAQPRDARIEIGGVFNNANVFQAITTSLGQTGQTPSNFSIIATDLDDAGRYAGIRFGLQDESAKLNINTLPILEASPAASFMVPAASEDSDSGDIAASNIAVTQLLALPGMTEDVADAILDWIDEDEEVRPFGAESEYYESLPTPYRSANGPLQSVEELLLVRGVTPTLLFGADANRNGVLDADEQQRFGVGVDTVGSLGWAAYLTVHGAEANKRDNGEPRVNVNGDDLELLYDELSAALQDDIYASFIVAYRIAGQNDSIADAATTNAALGINSADSGGGDSGGGDSGGGDSGSGDSGGGATIPWTAEALSALDLTAGGGTNFNQILDLIGATVTIRQGGEDVTYESPFAGDPISMAMYLPLIMDALTTQDTAMMPGRINLNECAAELLYGLPLLDVDAVEAILEARAIESDDPNRRFETWPMVAGLITLEQMKLMLPLVTGGGDVYSAQIIGYYEGSGAFHRNHVIIDATTVNPKIVSIQDVSHLGRAFDLQTLGLRSMVAGTF